MNAFGSYDLKYAAIDELAVEHAPPREWLSDGELAVWQEMNSAARRRTFLAGRILAKRLLREQQIAPATSSPRQITIRSRGRNRSGLRPSITLASRRLSYSLSISHTADHVLVAGTRHRGESIGVDLVGERQLNSAFARCWLTPAERRLLRQARTDLTAADIWALKEAVYKACQRGEPFAPRKIEIRGQRGRATVSYDGRHLGSRCRLRLWRLGGDIAALAIYQTSDEPVTFDRPKHPPYALSASTSIVPPTRFLP